MKVPSHLVGLYNRSVRRYAKLTSRLNRESNTTGYLYLTILKKLRNLRRKIAQLRFQLKLATATGAVVLALSFNSAKGQTHPGPFVPQPRHLNPLPEPFTFHGNTYPSVVDLDKDGDYDMVVGHEGNLYYDFYNPQYSTIEPLRYLLNTGTNTAPVFEEKTGEENPFNDIKILNDTRGPVFADIDEDGDPDMIVGLRRSFRNESSQAILYFRNENGAFIEQTADWDAVAKTGNPFAAISLTGNVKLAFADMDNDSDLDAVITGSYYDAETGTQRYISYFKNDGEGTFSDATSEFTFDNPPTESILNPALADLDKDGDFDLVLGGYYLNESLLYYEQVSPGNFVEKTGPYDAGAKTGNPFDGIYDPDTQPIFVDLDNDSDLDLLVGEGDGDHSYSYANNLIRFYENKGSSVFEERHDISNPLGGVNVKQYASPVLIDLDGDNDLDAIVGHKYEDYFLDFNTPFHYRNDDGKYVRVDVEDSPLGSIAIAGTITPSLVDIDADGDVDFISGSYMGGILLFENNEGEYAEVSTGSPFEGIDLGWNSSAEMADIDGDGDYDLVASSRYQDHVYYYENTGTPQSPSFALREGTEDPFEVVGTANNFDGYLALSDMDHDGDLDVVAIEYFYFKYDFNVITYYENTGSAKDPVFALAEEQPFVPTDNPFIYGDWELQPYLADQDQDGDLDLFLGTEFGVIKYTKNENPAVVASVTSGPVTYRPETDADLVIDPTLTLSDEDDDLVVQATVTITNYQQGDELHFVGQANIAGSFNNSTGVLTLKGKATRAEYQSILRTVNYHFHDESGGGRTRPGKKATVAKTMEFRVYDTDFTTPVAAGRAVNVLFNNPPIFENANEKVTLGQALTIGLADLMSDPDDNLDVTSVRIVQQPTSGAAAHIDANLNLIINYDGVNFAGLDQLTIEVCDDLGECAQNVITIDVESSGVIEVFNAVAPNSGGDNKFMRIHNLPAKSRVSIFSRWGDKVIEIEDYNSTLAGKRFEGLNANGKALPTGIYFYKIEIPSTPTYTGPKVITGYISLKQ